MKRQLLATIILSALSVNVLAQGLVTFTANGNTRPIEYTPDGTTLIKVPVGNPAIIPNFGQLTIALMAAPNGTPLSVVDGLPDFTSTWSQVSATISQINPAPGTVPARDILIPASLGASGSSVEMAIVAWTGGATTWDQAIDGGATALAWTGSSLSGGELEWSQPIGTEVIGAALVVGTSGFNGLVLSAVPDASSTLLLGTLGMGALWIFGGFCKRCTDAAIRG